MRKVGLVLAPLLLGACAGKDTLPLVECTPPRPQVCTMEYAPVCAEVNSGEMKTYSSACNACADDAVAGYLSGACPEGE